PALLDEARKVAGDVGEALAGRLDHEFGAGHKIGGDAADRRQLGAVPPSEARVRHGYSLQVFALAARCPRQRECHGMLPQLLRWMSRCSSTIISTSFFQTFFMKP